MIPFSPPYIFDEIIEAVSNVLKSGWITTGPVTNQFEQDLAAYTMAPKVLCLNSATAGLELSLRWFGIGPGDEVIIPAYTYAATANVILHCGATPVMVDIQEDDFNISPHKILAAITPKTKAVMPVDIGGMPCDYQQIMGIVKSAAIRNTFIPANEIQEKLGRIIVINDAAHSIGAKYLGRPNGTACDISIFSFHAVKNLTTAEGGAMILNLPEPFDNIGIYQTLTIKALHGQNKNALAKMKKGNWEYDIIEPGYKFNMPDVLAAIGKVSLKYYDADILPRRKRITEKYNAAFSKLDWAICPVFKTDSSESSYHLYMLRIKHITEEQRNSIISHIFNKEVSVNVHFKPLPLLSLYKNAGFVMADYPVAYHNFSTEISLPVYYTLTDEAVNQVIQAVMEAYSEVME